MIRLSKESDIKDIVRLWNEAFGDTEKDIMFFIDAHYIPENAVVCEIDGVIASVLFLLDGEMHIKGKDYPSYYLYAACTLKEYRGRGIMSDMLEFTKLLSAKRNKHFIALKPAEDSLYGYYSKFGYKAVFSKKITEISTNKQNKIYNTDHNSDFEKIRNRALSYSDYFKWNKKSIDFAVNHHKYYGGKVIADCNGYLLYTKNNNAVLVKENTFTSVSMLKNIIDKYFASLDSDTIRVELPFSFDTEDYKYKTVNSGMLLPLNKESEELILKINNAYLALTLD